MPASGQCSTAGGRGEVTDGVKCLRAARLLTLDVVSVVAGKSDRDRKIRVLVDGGECQSKHTRVGHIDAAGAATRAWNSLSASK